jgi:hypothetical protein
MRQNTTLLGLPKVTYACSRERRHCDCSLAVPHVPVPRVDNGENWRRALARSNSWTDSGSKVALSACEEDQAMSEAQVIIFPGVRAEQCAVNLAMQRSFQGAIGRNVVELRRLRLNRAFLKLNRLLTDDPPGARG